MNRRNFLGVFSLLCWGNGFAATSKTALPPLTPFISASNNTEGAHFVSYGASNAPHRIAVSLRGHSLITHPLKSHHVLLFARRPGTQCYELDLRKHRISQRFSTAVHHNFCGHGCFSQDGKYLFTTEMNNASGVGKIAVRDSQNYQTLHRFDSGGIDPHEMLLLSDGKTLVVANGGILTHPDSGRKKLNLETMHSNLVFLDAETGKIQQRLTTPWQHASLRHLAIGSDDTLALAMQYQREAVAHNTLIPLAGFVDKNRAAIHFAQEPEALLAQMNDYAGSVVLHETSGIAAFSSPRGNIVGFWQTNGEYAGHHRMQDVCGLGINAEQTHFILSNSQGEVRYIRTDNLQEHVELRQHYANTKWDNHLTVLHTDFS